MPALGITLHLALGRDDLIEMTLARNSIAVLEVGNSVLAKIFDVRATDKTLVSEEFADTEGAYRNVLEDAGH